VSEADFQNAQAYKRFGLHAERQYPIQTAFNMGTPLAEKKHVNKLPTWAALHDEPRLKILSVRPK
jgi:hypothetical protein